MGELWPVTAPPSKPNIQTPVLDMVRLKTRTTLWILKC